MDTLSNLLTISHQPLFLVDSNGQIIWTNAAADHLWQLCNDHSPAIDPQPKTSRVASNDIASSLTSRGKRLLHQLVHICQRSWRKAVDAPTNILAINATLPSSRDHKPNLLDIIRSPQGIRLEDCAGFQWLEIELKLHDGPPLPQTLLALEVGNGSPGAHQLLIALCPLPLPGSTSQTQFDELAAIAHDIRNPLSAATGYADVLLSDSVRPGLNSKQLKLVQRLSEVLVRASELVKNYQQLMSLRSGKVSPTAQPVDLNSIISPLAQDLKEQAFNRNLSVAVELTSNEIPVAVSPGQLERIVSNLCSNAYKYTPPGENITIRTTRSGHFALLSITNTGAFLPPSELGSIFNQHYRGPTVGNQTGSGLGLFICRSIIRAVGGTIRVDSNRRNGTTFYVELPLVPAIKVLSSSRALSDYSEAIKLKT